jgi:hypothetical protein
MPLAAYAVAVPQLANHFPIYSRTISDDHCGWFAKANAWHCITCNTNLNQRWFNHFKDQDLS